MKRFSVKYLLTLCGTLSRAGSYCTVGTVLAGLAVLTSGVIQMEEAQAQDMLVCAQVLPCNLDGSVRAPFNEGACAATYAKSCLNQKVNDAFTEVVSCGEQNSSLRDRSKKLEKTVHRLNRRIRRMQQIVAGK